MEILPPPEVSTEHWTSKAEQYELPNYRGVSPDAFKARGRSWTQDPAGRPWFDQDNAARKIDGLLQSGLISRDEETLLGHRARAAGTPPIARSGRRSRAARRPWRRGPR